MAEKTTGEALSSMLSKKKQLEKEITVKINDFLADFAGTDFNFEINIQNLYKGNAVEKVEVETEIKITL